MKNNSKEIKDEPTPVTLSNIKGGKKNRQRKYKGLRVLIDTGCSHSIIDSKYVKKKKQKINEKKYSIGSGILKTKHESEIHFPYQNLAKKK